MKTERASSQTILAAEASPGSLAEIRSLFGRPANPVPEEALDKLSAIARSDTGSSQVVRFFLFWLAGAEEPTGFKGEGGLELRRLDSETRALAIEVLSWWAGPTKSDKPLYDALRALNSKFLKAP